MTTHRSTAYLKSSQARHHWRKPEPITNQFRFVVRMAYACHERKVPYDLTWNLADGVMSATITATGNIPMPRPLPKAPRLKIVSHWKPAIWDAVYRMEAYHHGILNRMRQGFVIAHSCGLSLVHPSESGELGVIPYGSNPETCPVRTIQAWIELAGIAVGPLFRSINRHGQVQAGRLSGIDVARIVKKLAERAGLDAAKYAGHSLRARHATSAAIAGASERSIMNQTGHRSVQMVRRYIRDGSLFRENSAGKLGL